MTNKHIAGTAKLEDCRYHAREDGTGTGSGTTHIVGSLVLELHILQTRHIIRTKAATYHVLTSDGNRQTTTVLLEGAVQLTVLS